MTVSFSRSLFCFSDFWPCKQGLVLKLHKFRKTLKFMIACKLLELVLILVVAVILLVVQLVFTIIEKNGRFMLLYCSSCSWHDWPWICWSSYLYVYVICRIFRVFASWWMLLLLIIISLLFYLLLCYLISYIRKSTVVSCNINDNVLLALYTLLKTLVLIYQKKWKSCSID